MKTLTFLSYFVWCALTTPSSCVNYFFLENSSPKVVIASASTFIKCDTRKSDFDESLSEAIKNAITQLDRPMEEYNLPSLEPFFVPFFFPKAGEKPAFDSKFKNYRIFGHTKITDLKAT
jgi:hypothetical protein